MKGDDRYGEFLSVQFLPNFTLERFGTGGLIDMHNPAEVDKAEAQRGVDATRAAFASGQYDVVIMDEFNVVVGWKLVSVESAMSLIESRPTDIELVLTGRYAPLEFIRRADYVTMMGQKKHPYTQGIVARQGIDY
jgi:cob(I)alamin adenosyltransferase